ncbi:uncharacterized protein KY384_001366 [Bacidia gigantensis]|uniref:uncharacterized protein n=1 Tax=Bacidia gigantensis TaxID=2732470 RepID=UPI001D0584EB|nr:uncharacterized protein KY384_001366 [Bacidia gigantensis]KAG8533626.1 hypothetical protein KY384_001366 [Bacidia gigantensis]
MAPAKDEHTSPRKSSNPSNKRVLPWLENTNAGVKKGRPKTGRPRLNIGLQYKAKAIAKKRSTAAASADTKGPKDSAMSLADDAAATATLGLVNGIYDVTYASAEQESATQGTNLHLALDSPAAWGSFMFNSTIGILYLPRRPSKASEEALGFVWRGNEINGATRDRQSGDGWIQFLGDGVIKGTFNLGGYVKFEGLRREESSAPSRNGRSMRAEWNTYAHEPTTAEVSTNIIDLDH